MSQKIEIQHSVYLLSQTGLNEMAAILQTTFSSAFF